MFCHNFIGLSQVSSEKYVLDLENPEIRRKFNAHIEPLGTDSFMVCWEQGTKEINNNTIVCKVYDKDFTKSRNISFIKKNHDLKYTPVDIVKVDSSIYLYYMEMDTKVYHGKGVSSLKRAKLAPLMDTLKVEDDPIWQTDLGAGMQLHLMDDQFLMPIYGRQILDDGSAISAISTLFLDQNGIKLQDSSIVDNQERIKVFEPSIARGKDDTLLMIMRAHEKGHIHYTNSSDGGKTWSPIQESSIKSPESLSRIFYYKNHYFIVHNNLETGTTKPRNSLDITIVNNAQLKSPKTFNLIYHEKDFYSNFSILRDDNIVYIPYQRLMFSAPYRYTPDRIEMIKFDVNQILSELVKAD